MSKLNEQNNIDIITIIRNAIYLCDSNNEALFNQAALELLKIVEGVRNEAYDDKTLNKTRTGGKPVREIYAEGKKIKGNITVGIGFNMDGSEARKDWEKIFGNSVSFDAVRDGKLDKRRYLEAIIVNSQESPFYTAPEKELTQQKILDTISKDPHGIQLSICIKRYFADEAEYPDLFIWRTQRDQKVRANHVSKEGRIFRASALQEYEKPGQKHNCRCYAEPVPYSIGAAFAEKEFIRKIYYPKLSYMACNGHINISFDPWKYYGI